MLTFYLIAGGLAVLAAVVLARPLIAGRSEAENRDARDVRIFRDQLAELERDCARGTITPNRGRGGARRDLAPADRRRRARAPHRRATARAAGAFRTGGGARADRHAGAGGGALFRHRRRPGSRTSRWLERESLSGLAAGQSTSRPSQEEAEAQMAGQIPPPEGIDPQYAALVAKLEQTVAKRPDDAQGHRLLANALMQLGRYGEAWRTYDRLIELTGGSAGAEIHAAKAEGMILAAGGYVSPEAARPRSPRRCSGTRALPIARYYAGWRCARRAGSTTRSPSGRGCAATARPTRPISNGWT